MNYSNRSSLDISQVIILATEKDNPAQVMMALNRCVAALIYAFGKIDGIPAETLLRAFTKDLADNVNSIP